MITSKMRKKEENRQFVSKTQGFEMREKKEFVFLKI